MYDKGSSFSIVIRYDAMLALPTTFHVRSYRSADRIGIERLLWFLPSLYPSRVTWLTERLHDVERGTAYCIVATSGDDLVGTAIDTPKASRCRKLSTLYVSKKFQGLKVGTALISNRLHDWSRNDIEFGYVTCGESRGVDFSPFIMKHGFEEISREYERYHPGESEIVYGIRFH